MQLYYYQHCPFCAKVRFTLGLKNLPVSLQVVMADDEATPVGLVGKKIVPILVKDDDSAMTESLDIVAYLDRLDERPLLTGPLNPAITEWIAALRVFLKNLTYPRFARTDFAELATAEARAAYRHKETQVIGDLDDKFARSGEWLPALNESLAQLDGLLVSTQACNGELSLDDVNLFAFLRNVSIVKAATWPPRVERYVRSLSERSHVPLFFDCAL